MDAGLGVFIQTEHSHMQRPFSVSPSVDAMPDVDSYSPHARLNVLTTSEAPATNVPWRGYAVGADIAIALPTYEMETAEGTVVLDSSNYPGNLPPKSPPYSDRLGHYTPRWQWPKMTELHSIWSGYAPPV